MAHGNRDFLRSEGILPSIELLEGTFRKYLISLKLEIFPWKLIAFEFLYMASPFAAYFYGVYGLGLDWLQGSPTTRWLIQFLMPHLVEETTSFAIDCRETFGSLMFLGGLAAFAAGAVQVYSAKLRGRGAVTGGLYRRIRHPQYLALIVASIGMLLLWPRYLVVVATVTVIFVYIALARAEGERLPAPLARIRIRPADPDVRL